VNDLPPEVQDALPAGWGFGFWFQNPNEWHYRLTSPGTGRILGYIESDIARNGYRGGRHQFDANVIRCMVELHRTTGRGDITIDAT
jgi:hypothetical protein